VTIVAALLSGLLCSACGTSGLRPEATTSTSRYEQQTRTTCATSGHSRRLCLVLRAVADHEKAPRPPEAVRYYESSRTAIVTNAGSTTPPAYTFFVSNLYRVRVSSDSSARVTRLVVGPPEPATDTDVRDWKRSGSPALEPASSRKVVTSHSPAGTYSFLPQGSPLTFAMVRTLGRGGQPAAAVLLRALHAEFGSHLAPALVLNAYGYLLAVAPLEAHTRATLVNSLAALRHLTRCDRQSARRAHLLGLCAPGSPTETTILLDQRTGIVCNITQRLMSGSELYPHLKAGDIVGSVAFQPIGQTACPRPGGLMP
jgi:hypothetical protein